jgi:hypothetical protein
MRALLEQCSSGCYWGGVGCRRGTDLEHGRAQGAGGDLVIEVHLRLEGGAGALLQRERLRHARLAQDQVLHTDGPP